MCKRDYCWSANAMKNKQTKLFFFFFKLLFTVPLWLNSDINITLLNLNYTTNIKCRLS